MLFPPPFSSLELGFEEKKVPSVLTHFLQDHETIMQSWIILKRDEYSKENVSEPNFPLFDPPQTPGPGKARTFKFQQILLNNFGSSLTFSCFFLSKT